MSTTPSLHRSEKEFMDGQFTFSFEGASNINAPLLGRTILNLSLVIDEISKEQPAPIDYSFNVIAFRPGSFKVDFHLLVATGMSLLPNAMAFAKVTVDTLKGIFEIKKLLKGDKPKEVKDSLSEGSVEIVAPDNTHVIAPRGSKIIFRNSIVDRCVTEISQSALKCNPGNGFSIADQSGALYFSPDDLQNIAQPQEYVEHTPSERQNSYRVRLPIKKLDLLGSSAWAFKYSNRTIHATIADSEFLKKVHGGYIFKAGDCLDVELDINTKQASDGSITGEKYTIIKVYNVVKSPEQTSLL